MSDAPARYRELVIATGNAGKLLEFRALLGDLPLSVRSAAAFPEVVFPDEGQDYEANAIAKARAVAEGSGRPALGDDSGLEVAGLGGAPGPLSARYGGPDLDDAGRVGHLLAELAAKPDADRSACFVCVAALALPDGRVFTARGECKGAILPGPRGRGGFGYDPIFEVEEGGRSMAELPPAKKHERSHRGRAVAALREAIAEHVVDAR